MRTNFFDMNKECLADGFASLKAIFFDMDGVIYDSMGNHSVAWSEAFAGMGWDFPLEQVYLNEGRTGASTIHLLYNEKLGRPATEAEIAEIENHLDEILDIEDQEMTAAEAPAAKTQSAG